MGEGVSCLTKTHVSKHFELWRMLVRQREYDVCVDALPVKIFCSQFLHDRTHATSWLSYSTSILSPPALHHHHQRYKHSALRWQVCVGKKLNSYFQSLKTGVPRLETVHADYKTSSWRAPKLFCSHSVKCVHTYRTSPYTSFSRQTSYACHAACL